MAEPELGELKHLAIDHVAIAVHDLDAGEAPYRLIGLEREGGDEVVSSQQVRVRTLQTEAGLIELLTPLSGESPIARFLDRRGPGIHHIAFRVTALEREVERLAGAGLRFVDPNPSSGRAGSRVVFLHPKSADGVLIELVEHGS